MNSWKIKISMNIWEELVFAAALYATLKIVKRKIAVPTTAGFLSALFVKEYFISWLIKT